MKTASISELKQELITIPAKELAEICLRLARFKKENKELLTYLLFENNDEQAYINSVKTVMDELFAEVNCSNSYFAKKTLRKILRITNKYIRYTGSKAVEVELLLYFCSTLAKSGLLKMKSTQLNNLYDNQHKKIAKVIATMHEDLQYDYLKELAKIKAI